MIPSAEEFNVRLMAVEKTHGEILLGLQHSMSNNSQAITNLQQDMHRLVNLSEQQILLAERAAETSKAIDRAFGTIKDVRSDIVSLVKVTEENWQKWREKHEADNQETADWALGARGAVKALGIVGLVLWGLLGTIAWDWRDMLQQDLQALRRDVERYEADSGVRMGAISDQVQELRIARGVTRRRQEDNPDE